MKKNWKFGLLLLAIATLSACSKIGKAKEEGLFATLKFAQGGEVLFNLDFQNKPGTVYKFLAEVLQWKNQSLTLKHPIAYSEANVLEASPQSLFIAKPESLALKMEDNLPWLMKELVLHQQNASVEAGELGFLIDSNGRLKLDSLIITREKQKTKKIFTFGHVASGAAKLAQITAEDELKSIKISAGGNAAVDYAREEAYEKFWKDARAHIAAQTNFEMLAVENYARETWPGYEVERSNSGNSYIELQKGRGLQPLSDSRTLVTYRMWAFQPGDSMEPVIVKEYWPAASDLSREIGVIIRPVDQVSGVMHQMLRMAEGAEGVVILPPENAYRSLGLWDADGNVLVPPNTYMIFQLRIQKVL